MRFLTPTIKRLHNSNIRDLIGEYGSLFVGPFVVISPKKNQSSCIPELEEMWRPIKDHYFGSLISRYVRHVVADIKELPCFGVHLINSSIIMTDTSPPLSPLHLSRYFLRRAVYLRQMELGVRRNFFTSRVIAKRTTHLVGKTPLGDRLTALYEQ